MTPSANCAALIPDSWKDGVPGATIPTPPLAPSGVTQAAIDALIAAVKVYAVAFVEENGQREKANGRTADVIHIVTTCERLANAARPDAPKR